MMKTSTLVLIPLLSGGPLLAQAPASPVSGVSGPRGVLQSYGVAEADGPPLALGPDYRARFEPGRVTYTPAPITLYAQWAAIGGTSCDLVGGLDLSSGIVFDLAQP